MMTAEQLRDAREWIADCEWRDIDSADARHITDAEVERGIARHYAGGVAQFIADGA